MRQRLFAALAVAVILGANVRINAFQANAAPSAVPSDDPTAKLGTLVGKWQTQGSFTGGDKISTTLECRWSPQGSFLV